jgi:hypothetical protein
MVHFIWCCGIVVFGIVLIAVGVSGLVDMAWNRWGF